MNNEDILSVYKDIYNDRNRNGVNNLHTGTSDSVSTVRKVSNVNSVTKKTSSTNEVQSKKVKLYRKPESYKKMKDVKKRKMALIKKIIIGTSIVSIVISGTVKMINLINSSSNEDVYNLRFEDDKVVSSDTYEVSTDDNGDNVLNEPEVVATYPGVDSDNYTYVGYSDIDEVRDFLNNTEAGYYVKKYSEMYGIDAHVLAAICKIESLTLNHEDCIPGGRFYTGYGVGITELDFDKEYTEEHELYVSAHNYLTGEDDSVRLNMENAVNLETNIQISAMLFQNNINSMHGNILLAIQCHNYGVPMTEQVLYDNGLYDYIDDFSDLRWKDAMLDAHLHPYKYLSNDVWNYEKLGEYGGKNYVNRVLQFCEQNATYRYDDTIYTVNLGTGKVLDSQDVSSRTM